MKITPNDEQKEKNGVWYDYFGVSLLIKRSKPTEMIKKLRARTKGQGRVDIDDPKSVEVITRIMAEDILIDWKDFVLDGELIVYSIANAEKLLTQDPDCRDFVSTVSSDIGNYLLEDREEIVGE